jgi:hypothetical protein
MSPAPIASRTAATTSPTAAAAAAYSNADATAPVTAAVTAATAAVMTATASAVLAPSASVAAVTTMADKLYQRGCSVAFFVEDVEGSQADIRDFFLTKSDLISIPVAWSG